MTRVFWFSEVLMFKNCLMRQHQNVYNRFFLSNLKSCFLINDTRITAQEKNETNTRVRSSRKYFYWDLTSNLEHIHKLQMKRIQKNTPTRAGEIPNNFE